MNRIITCIGVLLLSFAFVSAAYAGAIDNRTNWSAEWVRTLNRNAATDFADIAMYNPAGTVKLHEGFTINGSLQYGMKDRMKQWERGRNEPKTPICLFDIPVDL